MDNNKDFIEYELFKDFSKNSLVNVCKDMTADDIRQICNEVIDRLNKITLSKEEREKYHVSDEVMLEFKRFVGKVLQSVLPNGKTTRLTENDIVLLNKIKANVAF